MENRINQALTQSAGQFQQKTQAVDASKAAHNTAEEVIKEGQSSLKPLIGGDAATLAGIGGRLLYKKYMKHSVNTAVDKGASVLKNRIGPYAQDAKNALTAKDAAAAKGVGRTGPYAQDAKNALKKANALKAYQNRLTDSGPDAGEDINQVKGAAAAQGEEDAGKAARAVISKTGGRAGTFARAGAQDAKSALMKRGSPDSQQLGRQQTSSRANRVNNNAIGDDDEDAPASVRGAASGTESGVNDVRGSLNEARQAATLDTGGSGSVSQRVSSLKRSGSAMKAMGKEGQSGMPLREGSVSQNDATLRAGAKQAERKTMAGTRSGAKTTATNSGKGAAGDAEGDLAGDAEKMAAKKAGSLVGAEAAESAIPGIGDIMAGLTAIGGLIGTAVAGGEQKKAQAKIDAKGTPQLAFDNSAAQDTSDMQVGGSLAN